MTIEEAVGRLPEIERRALTLRKVYEFSQDEIAVWLCITPSEVERALCGATRHLLEMIDIAGEETVRG
jgi:DNA-directed RNA polymerase specialized sigma24 family protein